MERKNAVCFCRIFCNYILFILLFAFISAVPIGMLGYGQNVYASEKEASEGTTLIEYAILLPDGKDTVTDILVNGEKYDGAIAPVTENGILTLLLPNATQTVALTFDDGEESYLLGPAESSPTVEPYSNVTLFTHNGNSYYRAFMKCYYPYSGTFTVKLIYERALPNIVNSAYHYSRRLIHIPTRTVTLRFLLQNQRCALVVFEDTLHYIELSQPIVVDVPAFYHSDHQSFQLLHQPK